MPEPVERQLLDELRVVRTEIAELREELRRARLAAGTVAPPRSSGAHGEARRRGPWELAAGLVPEPVRSLPTAIRGGLRGLRQEGEWTPPRPIVWDICALLVIGVAAWLLRSVDLAGIPQGLHGDEAATGLEARRILDTGWVGVYTGIAGGNPTGFYYLAAIALSLVSDPVVAVRLLSAVGGTVGVVALYVLMRRNIGFASAVVGAALFAFSGWHIQFSRIGFVTGSWPTCVLLGAIVLMEAIRSGSWRWWAAAGAMLSVGIYVYNGHGPFMIVLALFIVGGLFGWAAIVGVACLAAAWLMAAPASLAVALVGLVLLGRNRHLRDRTRLANATAFGVASLLVMQGILRFILAHPRDYLGRGDELSVFRTDAWDARSGLLDQARFLVGRYRDYWVHLSFDPRPNGVDLSGVTPIVPELTLWICLGGLAVALIRRPHPLVVFAALTIVAMPLAAVMTDLTLRRALVIAPFLALAGGIGVVEVVRLAAGRGRVAGVVVGTALIALVGLGSYQNYVDFFDETVGSGPAQQTFGTELRDTADYLDSLPPDAYVYFACDRWILEYDVVALIAPDVRGQNTSTVWGGTGTFDIDPTKGSPVFVLMGAYTAELAQLQDRYPGGQVVTGRTLGPPLDGPTFVAYALPAVVAP